MLLRNLFVCVNVRTIGICINFFPLKIGSKEFSRMITLFHLWLQASMSLLPSSTKYILLLAQDIFLLDVKTLRNTFYKLLTYSFSADLKPFGG